MMHIWKVVDRLASPGWSTKPNLAKTITWLDLRERIIETEEQRRGIYKYTP